MKKLLLLFVLTLLPMLACADYYDVKIDGIYYKLNNDSKEATVVMGCTETTWTGPVPVVSYAGDVVIPETFTYNYISYTVTSIRGQSGGPEHFSSYGAFKGCKDLTSITIPKTIKEIGYKAFSDCTSLQFVYISDLTAWCNIHFNLDNDIEYYSDANPLFFAHDLYLNGNKISNLTIPDKVTTIKEGTFIGCSISSVVFHKNVSGIGYKAFDGCNGLTDVYSYSKSLTTKGSFNEHTNKTLHIRERYYDSYFPADFPDYEPIREWKLFGNIKYIEDIDYNLVYVVDDAEYKKIIMEVGEAIIPEPEPKKEGYTFSGWSEIPEKMPAEDVTITGSFSPNTYKLIYNVDGKEYKVVEVKYDEAITAEPEPTKKGMTFSGWSEIPEKMPAKDVTVTGTFSWSKITNNKIIYQVTDTINNYAAVIGNEDISGVATIASDIEFDYNYIVTSIADRAFNGCKGITAIDIPASITSIGERAFAGIDKLTDVTILAEEVPTTDRTAFENSYLEYVTLHVSYSSVDKYKAVGPWKDFKEIVAIEGTQRTFVLTYKVDGEVYKTYEVKEGVAITPEPEPTKEGYTFSGWSEIPAVMPSENLTITGTFIINKYKLTYIVDEKEYKVFEVEYNAAITPEPAPEKEGYTFSGWSDIPTTMPANDVEVTGSFTVNKYNLIYKVDGEVYKEYEMEYGAEITPEEEPTKEGWKFSGWSWIPKKMPAEDVVITGTFKQVDYEADGSTYTIADGEATLKDGGEAKGALVINNNVTIDGKVYVIVNIGDGAFKGNKDIISVELPDGIKNIGAGAFDGCSSLLKVLLGKGVQKIGSKAFGNIWKAAAMTRAAGDGFRVECNAESVPEIETDAFEGTEIEKATLVVKDELVNSYKTAEVWKNFGSIIGQTEATDIDGIFTDNPSAVIYSIDGRRLDKVQKGMNVIRTEKGVKKVVVR